MEFRPTEFNLIILKERSRCEFKYTEYSEVNNRKTSSCWAQGTLWYISSLFDGKLRKVFRTLVQIHRISLHMESLWSLFKKTIQLKPR